MFFLPYATAMPTAVEEIPRALLALCPIVNR
jgi:hypothetical protein